jgi:hypothetical protein
VYGLDAKSRNGSQIDSRSRRAQLFGFGVFDCKVGLLARQNHEGRKIQEVVNEWKRILFHQNSVVFSPRPLPVDLSAGPVPLVGGGSGSPESDNGDALTITDVSVYSVPKELLEEVQRAAPQASSALEASMRELTIDLRCSDCTKSFLDEMAMKQHCEITGHSPVIMGKGGGGLKVANREIFLQYANVVLKRALGERLAPW